MVSIALPIYNGEKYLAECVDSILAQTDTDWELIASDDASADRSVEILKAYADPRIRVIRNQGPRGIFQNLNNAIRHAAGDYIQIFNQDDVMTPGLLQKQVEALTRHPAAGMVFCKKQNIDETGAPIDTASQATTRGYHTLLPELMDASKGYQYFTAFGCIPGNLSPVMITRKAWAETGAFNESFPYAGDFEYWVRVSENFGVVFNDDYLCKVRTHATRASSVLGKKNLGLVGQMFTINRSLLDRYPDGEQRAKAASYLQRTVGIYQLHTVTRFALAGKAKAIREIWPQFHGVFSIRHLWWKYLRYRLDKKRASDYPLF